MKIKTAQLLKELQTVEVGLADKEQVEQSTCLVFKGGEVLTYNDEVACRLKTCLKIEGAINGKVFLNALKDAKPANKVIFFKEGKGRLLCKAKHMKGGFNITKEITLPVQDVEPPKVWHPLPSKFPKAVRLLADCASNNLSMPHLSVINITATMMEACDGKQIGRYKIKTPLTAERTLVRAKALNRIMDLGMSEIGATKNWLHFRNEKGLRASISLIPEKYLSDRITAILKIRGKPVKLPIDKLKRMVETANIHLSTEMEANKWLRVDIADNQLLVTVAGSQSSFTLDAGIKYVGKPISFCIVPRLLAGLCNKQSECEIGKGSLRIKKGQFTYCASLWLPK